jgi:hypothetical protein
VIGANLGILPFSLLPAEGKTDMRYLASWDDNCHFDVRIAVVLTANFFSTFLRKMPQFGFAPTADFCYSRQSSARISRMCESQKTFDANHIFPVEIFPPIDRRVAIYRPCSIAVLFRLLSIIALPTISCSEDEVGTFTSLPMAAKHADGSVAVNMVVPRNGIL